MVVRTHDGCYTLADLSDVLSPPRVSVVIPAYFSSGHINDALDALRVQSFKDFETIVVNSSPEQDTERTVTERYPEVRFFQSPTRLLPHAARNFGLEHAQGEILVFTDPDCRARPDWLELLVAAHDEGHPVVGGGMALRRPDRLQTGVHLCKFSWLLETLPRGHTTVICTANASYSRAVWDDIGPFDGHLFTGDAFQSWKAFRHGYPVWFEPRAVVEHVHDGDLVDYVREFCFRGREYSAARGRFESWSSLRALGALTMNPVVPFVEISRSGKSALRAGWARPFFGSLPIQVACRVAWALGEARGLVDFVAARSGAVPAAGASR